MLVKQRGGSNSAPAAAKGRKTARSQIEINAERRAKERAQILRRIDECGPEPMHPSNCFTAFKKHFYNIDMRQLVSCKVTPGVLDVGAGETHRTKRRLKVINAGSPTASNPFRLPGRANNDGV